MAFKGHPPFRSARRTHDIVYLIVGSQRTRKDAVPISSHDQAQFPPLWAGAPPGPSVLRDQLTMENMMSQPKGKHSAPGQGNVYARANEATCKITAADTNGTFEIFDEKCKPGFESRLHMHTKSFQTCYVVEGSGEFLVGDELFEAKQGACINIPPGVAHRVGSKNGMRMLMVYSPPGLESMMKAMYALTKEQLADAALTAQIARAHDTIMLGEAPGDRGKGSVLG